MKENFPLSTKKHIDARLRYEVNIILTRISFGLIKVIHIVTNLGIWLGGNRVKFHMGSKVQ